MQKLLTKEDIKIGIYITVVRSVEKIIHPITNNITYDQSFQNDCMLINAVDLPLIRVHIINSSNHTYTLNLDKYIIRELKLEFVDQILKELVT